MSRESLFFIIFLNKAEVPHQNHWVSQDFNNESCSFPLSNNKVYISMCAKAMSSLFTQLGKMFCSRPGAYITKQV